MIVSTDRATYVFDKASMTVTQLPKTNGGTYHKDGEQFLLYSWPRPVKSRPMVFAIRAREGNVPTVRITTPVTAIEDIEEEITNQKEEKSVKRLGKALYDTLYLVAVRVAAEYTVRYIIKAMDSRTARRAQRPSHH